MNKKLIGVLAGGAVLVFGVQAHAATLVGGLGVQVGSGSGSAQASSSDQMQGMEMASTTLEAQVGSGAVNASSSDIISLQGNSVGMIQDNADLSAYNDLVVKARPAVRSVNVNSDNSIDVGYSQPAKFLGIFSTSISGTVHVDASGNTTVQMPWYAFLYSKDSASVATSAATAVQQSGVQFSAQADAMTTLQNNARIVNAVSAAVEAQAQASATASGSASY